MCFGKKCLQENNLMMIELTEREKDVLKLIVQEFTTHEIVNFIN